MIIGRSARGMAAGLGIGARIVAPPTRVYLKSTLTYLQYYKMARIDGRR